jgi:hypothetical protein
MMDCLIDYIGLAGCGSTTPASGLFINSLPGISLKSIAQLADEEQKTYIGVWNDVQLRAIKRLELNMVSALSKEYKIKKAKYSILTQPETISTTSQAYSVPTIKLSSTCDSPLGYHHIESITVRKVQPTAGVNVTVLDANDNTIIYNVTFNSNNQTVQTVNINQDFYQTDIYIKVITSLGLYYSDSTYPIYFNGGSIRFGTHNAGVFTEGNVSFGFNLNYGLRCSLSNLACQSKDLFTLTLWYLLGSELMMERLISDRINKWTIDKKQAEELKAYYDAESEKALNQAINSICFNDTDCCIFCDPPIAVREAYL